MKPRRVGSWEPNEKVFPSGAVIGQVRWGLRNDLWIIFLEVGLIFQVLEIYFLTVSPR